MSRMPLFFLFAAFLVSSTWGQKTSGSGVGTGSGRVTIPDFSDTPEIATMHHAEDEGRLVFKSRSVLLQVPVVVTDKSGGPVKKLTKEDFQVSENGKEQKIATFEEIIASNSPLPVREKRAGEFRNVVLDGQAARAVTVIALDTINTPYLDQSYGRKQLIKYLADNIDSNQVLALVMITSKGLKVIHGLTADPKELIEVLKKASGESPALQPGDADALAANSATGPTSGASAAQVISDDIFGPPLAVGNTEVSASNPVSSAMEVSRMREFILNGDTAVASYKQDMALESTLHAFQSIAWSLSGIPGRKSLIWATGSFPFNTDSPSSVPGGPLSVLYERVFQALNDSQVAVYPVDVRGLVNYLPNADASATIAHGSGPAMQVKAQARSWQFSSSIDTLRDFADMTGGRAFYNNNDLAAGFQRAAADSSSYYLLGYYLDNKNDRPGWRKLSVKVRQPDVEVRARSGFFVTNATINYEASQRMEMAYALNSPFDATGLPVTVQWQGVTADGDHRKVAFSLSLPGTAVTVNTAEKNHFSLDLAGTVDRKGAPSGSFSQRLQGDLPPAALDQLRASGAGYQSQFELAPGQYVVRFVVRDNLSGRLGSVAVPLTVN